MIKAFDLQVPVEVAVAEGSNGHHELLPDLRRQNRELHFEDSQEGEIRFLMVLQMSFFTSYAIPLNHIPSGIRFGVNGVACDHVDHYHH